jgi:hypothetical protein
VRKSITGVGCSGGSCRAGSFGGGSFCGGISPGLGGSGGRGGSGETARHDLDASEVVIASDAANQSPYLHGPIVSSGGTAADASHVTAEPVSVPDCSTSPVGTVTVAHTLFAQIMYVDGFNLN